jgi:hypothetical protein
MLAVPAATAVTVPFCVTVATAAADVAHDTVFSFITESRWSLTVAVSAAVAPTASASDDGETDTLVTTGVNDGVLDEAGVVGASDALLLHDRSVQATTRRGRRIADVICGSMHGVREGDGAVHPARPFVRRKVCAYVFHVYATDATVTRVKLESAY